MTYVDVNSAQNRKQMFGGFFDAVSVSRNHNPCVGGSIPSPATNLNNRKHKDYEGLLGKHLTGLSFLFLLRSYSNTPDLTASDASVMHVISDELHLSNTTRLQRKFLREGLMAKIGVEDQVYGDPRYKILGEKLGTSKFDAWGRMLPIWNYCTEQHTHSVHGTMIDILAEFDGFADMICDPLIHLAEKNEDGTYLIIGTRGKIEWLKKLKDNGEFGKLGGRPKKKTQDGKNKKPTRVSENNPHGSEIKTPSVSVFVSASDIVSVNKENIKEIFEFFFQKFKKDFGVPTRGAHALKRFKEQIKDLKSVGDLNASLTHYREFLDRPTNSYRAPKQSFATFLGTEDSEYFWRDFIEKPPDKAPGESPRGTNWEDESQIVFEAIRKFGPDETEGMITWLGEDRWRILEKIPGGIFRIRMMPFNSFSVKSVASDLKAAFEKQKKSGGPYDAA